MCTRQEALPGATAVSATAAGAFAAAACLLLAAFLPGLVGRFASSAAAVVAAASVFPCAIASIC